jgi:hypothetical protein
VGGSIRFNPREAFLDFPDLGETFFGDGEWFNEDTGVAKIIGDDVEVTLVIDVKLSEKAVNLVDATLFEAAGFAEVLEAGAAGFAVGVGARAADRRDNQLADLDIFDVGTDFDHFAETFVAEDEIVITLRWLTVNEGANFAVGAADADFERFNFDLLVAGNTRHVMVYQANFSFARSHSDRTHGCAAHY